MALENPVIVPTGQGQWALVVTNVQRATVDIQNGDVLYYRTYRKTGEAAPSNLIPPGDADFEGVPVYNRRDRIAGQDVFVGGLLVDEFEAVDVYLWTVGGAGRVIVGRSV